MTARTITEIRDVAADGDTITTIRVGPHSSGLVEIAWHQWSVGERDPADERSALLDLDDARALLDALSRSIYEVERAAEAQPEETTDGP